MDRLEPVNDHFYGLPELEGSDLFDSNDTPSRLPTGFPAFDLSDNSSEDHLSARQVNAVPFDIRRDYVEGLQGVGAFTSLEPLFIRDSKMNPSHLATSFAQDNHTLPMPMPPQSNSMFGFTSFGTAQHRSTPIPTRFPDHGVMKSNSSGTSLSASSNCASHHVRNGETPNLNPGSGNQKEDVLRKYLGVDINLFATTPVYPRVNRLWEGFDKFMKGETLFTSSKPIHFGQRIAPGRMPPTSQQGVPAVHVHAMPANRFLQSHVDSHEKGPQGRGVSLFNDPFSQPASANPVSLHGAQTFATNFDRGNSQDVTEPQTSFSQPWQQMSDYASLQTSAFPPSIPNKFGVPSSGERLDGHDHGLSTKSTDPGSNMEHSCSPVKGMILTPAADLPQTMNPSVDRGDEDFLALLNSTIPESNNITEDQDMIMTNIATAISPNDVPMDDTTPAATTLTQHEINALIESLQGPEHYQSMVSQPPPSPISTSSFTTTTNNHPPSPPPPTPRPQSPPPQDPPLPTLLLSALSNPLLSTITILSHFLPQNPSLLLSQPSPLLLRCVRSGYGTAREITAHIPDSFFRSIAVRKIAQFDADRRLGRTTVQKKRKRADQEGNGKANLKERVEEEDMTEEMLMENERRKFVERVRKRMRGLVREEEEGGRGVNGKLEVTK